MKLLPLITFQQADNELVHNIVEGRKAQSIDITHSLWDYLGIIVCDDLHNIIDLLAEGIVEVEI